MTAAAFYIMTDLERRFGTLCTLGTRSSSPSASTPVGMLGVRAGQVLLFAVLDALLYCGGYFATVGSRVNGYFGPVVGFSGVLFSQLVVETAVLPPGTRRRCDVGSVCAAVCVKFLCTACSASAKCLRGSTRGCYLASWHLSPVCRSRDICAASSWAICTPRAL